MGNCNKKITNAYFKGYIKDLSDKNKKNTTKLKEIQIIK